MSDHPIILRRDPGRDSTASDIARSRGEFRRRPHVEVDAAAAAPVPATTTQPAQAATPSPPVSRGGRLLH
jgi:hypothetical protein